MISSFDIIYMKLRIIFLRLYLRRLLCFTVPLFPLCSKWRGVVWERKMKTGKGPALVLQTVHWQPLMRAVVFLLMLTHSFGGNQPGLTIH